MVVKGAKVEDQVDDDRITLVGLLDEAHALLGNALSRELWEECELALPWYVVLVRLARNPEGRLRMSDLAAAVSLTSSGATRLVDRIEAAGLIERVACPSDRRVAYAAITDKGRDVLARATPVHLRGLQSHLVEPLSAAERDQLESLLRKLRDANAGAPACPER